MQGFPDALLHSSSIRPVAESLQILVALIFLSYFPNVMDQLKALVKETTWICMILTKFRSTSFTWFLVEGIGPTDEQAYVFVRKI